MEGNCYSWLCRLMNTLSFSQHHMLKIQLGQVMPSGSCFPLALWPRGGPGTGGALGQEGEAKCAGVEGKMLRNSQKFTLVSASLPQIQGTGKASYRLRTLFRDELEHF